MYPSDVIVMKNGTKVAHCISIVNANPKTLHFVELAYMLEKRYCFIGII